MKRRIIVSAGILIVFLSCLLQAADRQDTEVRRLKDVKIPMRDGVELSANITVAGPGSYPVIIVRTPYGKGNGEDDEGLYWAENGYAFVIQDCRGTGDSEGDWYPAINENRDGLDTHQWVLKQKWCNGKIATAGGSYLGYTQMAIAPDADSYLKAMFAFVPLIGWYEGCAYHDGAFRLALLMGWGSDMVDPTAGEGAGKPEDFDLAEAYKFLPLSQWDKTLGRKIDFLRDWVAHPLNDKYWWQAGSRGRLEDVKAPGIIVSGWYDIFTQHALDYVSTVRSVAKSSRAGKHSHLIIGPWGHGPNGEVGERDFGDNWQMDVEGLMERWFEHWLRGKDTNVEDLPPYRIFVMGRNTWRDENEWPLKRTEYTKYYFHSDGQAGQPEGSGHLNTQKCKHEPNDSYIYDPCDPVPTTGGNNLVIEAGPFDQREIEQRKDVLVYTSDKLDEELEVTGPVKVILYAASSVTDTDWTAKLVDVYPDGRAFNLCDGIVRARFRNSDTETSLIKPGTIYRYVIDLWATSNVFLKGHRIRVEVSSSNFPKYDRNPNTGHPFGADAELRKAEQTVYHNEKYPSCIVLPVIDD